MSDLTWSGKSFMIEKENTVSPSTEHLKEYS